jgi:hypothetical protein
MPYHVDAHAIVSKQLVAETDDEQRTSFRMRADPHESE